MTVKRLPLQQDPEYEAATFYLAIIHFITLVLFRLYHVKLLAVSKVYCTFDTCPHKIFNCALGCLMNSQE